MDKPATQATVAVVWSRKPKMPKQLQGSEPWQRKTRNLLSDPQLRTLNYNAPFTSLSHDIPNSHIETWYGSIMQVAGYATLSRDDTNTALYYPGVGFTPQLVSYLLLNRHAPLGFLKYVPWGVFCVALEKAGTAKATNRGLLWQYAEEEYGLQGAEFLKSTAPTNMHTRAPWQVSMCHHNTHRVLATVAAMTPTQLKTLALLQDRFELDSNLTGRGKAVLEYQTQYGVELSCCAQYPDARTNAKVTPTLAVLQARPRWFPCPPSVIFAVSKAGSNPTDMVTAQLWTTSRQPLHQVRAVAEAATK